MASLVQTREIGSRVPPTEPKRGGGSVGGEDARLLFGKIRSTTS